MIQEKSKFSFLGYTITHSEITLSDKSDNTEYSIDIEANGKVEGNEFSLFMTVLLNSNDDSISAKVSMCGNFEFDETIEADTLDSMFCANAAAIIFPYIRSYITTLTSLSGVEPVILPTLNMSPLGEEIRKSLKK